MSLKSNRWYDNKPNIVKSVKLLETFPPEIQKIIAEGIIDLANSEYEASEILKSYKSLGSEKIMGLHKSQSKSRTLDQTPETFKAMSYMYVLSPENQNFMAQKIVEVSEFIFQYFKTCQVFSEKPSTEEVRTITETYIQKGSKETEQFLAALANIVSKRRQEEQEATSQYLYEDSKHGMRISD